MKKREIFLEAASRSDYETRRMLALLIGMLLGIGVWIVIGIIALLWQAVGWMVGA